ANTVRAPNRSVTQPLAGMNTATVRRYADIPMLRSTAATPNDCAIWGSAVAITVPSSCSMNSAPATKRAMTTLCRRDLSMAHSGRQWSRIAVAGKPDGIDFVGNSKISSFPQNHLHPALLRYLITLTGCSVLPRGTYVLQPLGRLD